MLPKFSDGQVSMKTWVFFAALVLAQAAYAEDRVKLPLVDSAREFLRKKPA